MTKAHYCGPTRRDRRESLRYPPINEASPISEVPRTPRLTRRLLCVTDAERYKSGVSAARTSPDQPEPARTRPDPARTRPGPARTSPGPARQELIFTLAMASLTALARVSMS